jgi:hypothetical protein
LPGGFESGDVELSNVDALAHIGLLASFFEAAAAAEIAHRGDNEVTVLGEFDGGQQVDTAGVPLITATFWSGMALRQIPQIADEG